ncbi:MULTISPECIES: D-aminoacyl-tRNA deacylase [Paenibacillus]|uniref:D-aminoacyl-tRNA deacylase n=1 Tax=Paenibacillus naphthalenovorans TaxID=162209 RepID=A0A0U2WCX5_9BACL|nr:MULTISPECIES: D-aminoacyl-tRNA deacylase [Paenibacillus]ALS23194.1 D-tyrosyl-tRNA(Tyr) deacylase [Paenibacillus naphthalenovorans]NTZ17218.1 D-tyrosyl-tRNA(Tyr) deacylase [Paenibacillus sp. JMULE4]SDI13263.1 D-tyrosyl-tRNA(Tyr) deacylase [Paenibacillus naphthalenovorans]
MRVVLQRSKNAAVTVDGQTVGKISHGLVLLVGIADGDTEQDAAYIAEKVAGLRIFDDQAGRMNLSVLETGGQVLSISQFTLYGDCRKGRRPNFMGAARPEHAEPLYDRFNDLLRERGLQVETGRFGARMDVSLVNDGPVTLIVESRQA